MFCPKCGAQLPEGTAFCTNCGSKLARETQNAANAEQQAANAGKRPADLSPRPESAGSDTPPMAKATNLPSAQPARSTSGSALVKIVAVVTALAAACLIVFWAIGYAGSIGAVVNELSTLEAPVGSTVAVVYSFMGILTLFLSLRVVSATVLPLGKSPYPARAFSHAFACGIALLFVAGLTVALPALASIIMPVGYSVQHAQSALEIGIASVRIPAFAGAAAVLLAAALGRFGLRAHLGDKSGVAFGPKPQTGSYEAARQARRKKRNRAIAGIIAGAVAIALAIFGILFATGTIKLPDISSSSSGSSAQSSASVSQTSSSQSAEAPATVEEMAQQTTDVHSDVKNIETRYADENGYVSPEDVPALISEVEAYANENLGNTVESYEATESALLFKLESGVLYAFCPKVEGTWEGGNAVSVSTYEPYAHDKVYVLEQSDDPKEEQLNQEVENLYNNLTITTGNYARDGFVDIDGHYLANKTSGIEFASNINDAEVSIEACKSFGPNQIILWEGHGTWFESTHSIICTGVTSDNRSGAVTDVESLYKWLIGQLNIYQEDIAAGRLVVLSDGTLAVTSAFFDYYYGEDDLLGTTFYFTACRGMMDETLASTLASKGARAVLGYTRSVSICYGACMRDEVVSQLTNGATYGNAIKAAQDKYGEYDSYLVNIDGTVGDESDSTGASIGGARLVIYPQDANALKLMPTDEELAQYAAGNIETATVDTREIVVALDVSGSMAGTPLSKTIEAVGGFSDEVFASSDTRMSLITYSSSATTHVAHSAGAGRIRLVLPDLSAKGATDIEAALVNAQAILAESESNHKVLVLMSDDLPNEGASGDDLIALADELKDAGVLIYTLGFFQNSGSSEKTAGQKLLNAIASTGCHYEVDSEEVLELFFSDIADIINGTRYMYVTVACPVNVTVTLDGEKLESNADGKSARTSFGSITYVNNTDENGNVLYNDDGTVDQTKIIRLREGASYDIEIEGTGKGTMDYSIGFLDENGEYTDFRRFENIKVTQNLRVHTIAEMSDQTNLVIDLNNDGIADQVLFAGANERGHERDSSPEIMRALMVEGVITALALAAWIALFVRRLSRRRR